MYILFKSIIHLFLQALEKCSGILVLPDHWLGTTELDEKALQIQRKLVCKIKHLLHKNVKLHRMYDISKEKVIVT